MPSLFFSYSHKDEELRDQLETQLAMLKRQGVIEAWHDRRIPAGGEINREIDQHINTDDIILLLISPDFIASDYCYMGQDDNEVHPMLVVKDHRSKAYGATMIDEKGAKNYPVKYFKGFITRLGYKELISRSDNEKALLALEVK